MSLIFPQWCANCGSYGELLCKDCFLKIEFSGIEPKKTEYCDGIFSACKLNSVTKNSIYQLKYGSVKQLGKICARILYLYSSFPEADYITDIPLHPTRKNSRGFNQAEEIAKELSQLLKYQYLATLDRTINTRNLASIVNPEERAKVIQNQFKLKPAALVIKDKRVIIVDDVWTTGSTLNEAARILKMGGAQSVFGVTFAHGM